MPITSDEYFRPEKLDDAHTVLFEIDMLRFAKNRLLTQPLLPNGDKWVYLETFLLHYRNLIEFFGKPVKQLRPTDLSICRPEGIWQGRLPAQTELDFMTREDLWETYDAGDNLEAISKYLHHCTTQRTQAKNWRVKEMFEELRPVIEKFESLLTEYKPATAFTSNDDRVAIQTPEGNRTDSTRTFQCFPLTEQRY